MSSDALCKKEENELNKHKHPHYHLRLNKAIDRLIFIDIIKAFSTSINIQKKKYRYVGFGGPYLEDFKLVSGLFPNMKMVSLETDKETHKRQIFHKCTKNIQLLNDSFDKFLDQTDLFDKYPVIIWLDFTDDTIKCLRQIEALCKRIIEKSLIRITLNSEPNDNSYSPKYFEKIHSEYLSIKFKTIDLEQPEKLSKIVCQMAEKSINKGLQSAKLVFLPLHRVRYRDGQQMITLTGIICEQKGSDDIFKKMKDQCPYLNTDNGLDIIDIPALTLKERLNLDRYLPTAKEDGKTIAKKLGYMIEELEDKNLRKCKQYEKYYRYYPHFNKIIP